MAIADDRPLRQGRLFDATDLVPPVPTVAGQIADARAYVARMLARRVCVACCAALTERPLHFVHRRPLRPPLDNVVARLVQAGVGRARLAEEMAKCDVLCVRCKLARVRPQMLGAARPAFIGVVAKGRSTTGSSAKALHGASRRKTG